MSDDMITAAELLADTLEAENAALAAFDLPAAAALLDEKRHATQSLTSARSFDATHQRDVGQAFERLRRLAEQNSALLERAIAVQGRVIEIVATAAVQACATPRYGAYGSIADSTPPAMALRTRV
jgi:hypothetical protein